jgi:ubiquinone/menaquinone biosynthesis C-methylase UbiE
MGEASNRFHRELIRPSTEKLLNVQKGQTVLDIACGNGNFSRRLAELGAEVIAFDYSAKMVERARLRSKDGIDHIDYRVVDATDDEALLALGRQRFDSAVANMALMDIADITPLIRALHTLLQPNGVFVFSITHPCFQTPHMRKVHEVEEVNGEMMVRDSIQISRYLTAECYSAIGIRNQPLPHLMFHRPLSYYLNLLFSFGFVLDGTAEPSFSKDEDNGQFDWYEMPPAIIFRFRKMSGSCT